MDVFTPVVQPVVQQNQSAVQFELERVLAREVGISQAAGSGTLYTAPTGVIETSTSVPNQVVVTRVSVNCIDTTFKLHVVPSGGTADTTNCMWSGTLQAPTSYKSGLGWKVDLKNIYMNTGDTLQVTALTNGGTTSYFFVHGKEYF